jgi:hypothetical protein
VEQKIEHRLFCHITQNWRLTIIFTMMLKLGPTAGGIRTVAWVKFCKFDQGTRSHSHIPSEPTVARSLEMASDDSGKEWA